MEKHSHDNPGIKSELIWLLKYLVDLVDNDIKDEDDSVYEDGSDDEDDSGKNKRVRIHTHQ